MKFKFLVLSIAIGLTAMILTSCSINLFKSLDTPKEIASLARISLEQAKSGNFQGAIANAAKVFQAISNESFRSSDFYNAIQTSDTSTSSRNEIESLTNFLNSTASTNTALKTAAEAMMNSINATMRLGGMTLANQFLKIYQKSSAQSISSASTPNYAIISGLELFLSSAHNTQLMNLLEALSSTLNRCDPSNSNWIIDVGIYSTLKIPIILFDSNGNGVLEPGDRIYTYLWNYQAKSFKSQITPQDYNNILYHTTLQTYKNIQKSTKIIQHLSTALTYFDKGLLMMIQQSPNSDILITLRKYVDQLEIAMYVVNAQMISGIQNLGGFINYFSGQL